MDATRISGPALLGASLAACTNLPGPALLGLPAAEVEARLGTPREVWARDGGERLVYPTGPMGQQTTLVDLGADGLVAAVTPALTDERFAMIEKGVWNERRVREEFGPPALTSALPLRGWHVWSYRYRQQGVWNSLMHVHFDAQGVVRDYYALPDPMYDPDDRFRLRVP